MQETWVWSLGWEDSLAEGMATYSSILAWRIPWTEEEPGGLQSMRSQRVGHNWATNTHMIALHTLATLPVIPISVKGITIYPLVKANTREMNFNFSFRHSPSHPIHWKVLLFLTTSLHLHHYQFGNLSSISCLENPMDRGGAWWATVHGFAQSQTWLSDIFFFLF